MATSDPSAINPGAPTATSIPRRGFVELLLSSGIIATAAAFVYPVLRYFVPPKTTDVGGDSVVAGKVGELKPNSGKIFRFGSRPGLLILTADGEYRALSAVCTHLSCTVQFRPDLREVWCACHNGVYGLDGRNISGPPPRPLESFDVQVRGNEIYVTRRRES